ncbi:hypothetical protein DRP04_11275 [Archaeoglobales archaeon]|nr:MAG: hypothetical protein DRP04_11275 [Archaeoglobales archaeon]
MKFLGYKELSREELITPSPKNPRLKGLTPNEPSVKALAESIKKDGQLQPIIVRPYKNGKYEVIDGDRRCVAIFKILKWPKIKAAIYELDELEALRLRLVSNIQREDLTPVEKGKYCCDLFEVLALAEKLDPDKAWGNRVIRSKLLAQIANDIGVTPTTIVNWIRLWQIYPPHAQKLIAGSKEDLRKGLIPPTTALEAAKIAKLIGAKPEKVLELIIKNNWPRKKLEELKRAIQKGEIEVNPENMEQVISDFIRNLASYGNLYIERELYQKAAAQAKRMKIRFPEFVNLALKFSMNHLEEFKKFVALEAVSA